MRPVLRRTTALRLTTAVGLTLALSACSGAVTPGWTFSPATPAPSASVGPSGSPSVEPPASASVEPSASASVIPSASASVEPSGSAPADDAVTISALNIAFEQASVEVPAGAAFTITFENKDAGIPHNVEIKDAAATSVFTGDIFNGVDSRDYAVPALPAGPYSFVCTVHPNMTGTMAAG